MVNAQLKINLLLIFFFGLFCLTSDLYSNGKLKKTILFYMDNLNVTEWLKKKVQGLFYFEKTIAFIISGIALVKVSLKCKF